MSLSPPTKPVYLRAASMATPVGLTAAQSASAIRAGISGYAESSIYNKHAAPMTIASLPVGEIPELCDVVAQSPVVLTSRQARMVGLAGLAYEELSAKHQGLEGLPFLHAGPETLPEMPEACHADFLDHAMAQIGQAFSDEYSALLTHGKAGGLEALYHGMRVVEAGRSKSAVIGGADTFLDLYLLSTLDAENRVLSDGVMDGFAPGEGAGYLVVSSERGPFEDSGKEVLLYPPGLAEEPGHRYSDEPYRGDGLAEAFAKALDIAQAPAVKTIFASLNGENFGAKELGVALTRNSGKVHPEHVIEHPAECIGDVGAACVPIYIALAAHGLVNGYVEGPVLSYASSEGKHRGAVCMALA